MVSHDNPTGRRSASRYVQADAVPVPRNSTLITDLATDMPMRRVLWMLAHGMVWPWLVRDLCEADAVDRAISRGFVDPPLNDEIPYHLTDTGRAFLMQWHEVIRPHRDNPDFAPIWRAVTWK